MRPIYNKSLDLDKVIVILCERLIQICDFTALIIYESQPNLPV